MKQVWGNLLRSVLPSRDQRGSVGAARRRTGDRSWEKMVPVRLQRGRGSSMPEDVAMTRFIETIPPIVNDHASSSESTPPPAPPRPLYRRPQWLALMAIAAVVVVVVGGRYL